MSARSLNRLPLLLLVVCGLLATTAACGLPGSFGPPPSQRKNAPEEVPVRVEHRITVPDAPQSIVLSPDGSRAYVGTQETLTVIDTAAAAVIRSVPINSYSGDRGLAVSPDGRRLYVESAAGIADIAVIDTASLTVTGKIDAGVGTGSEMAVSPDGATLYASGATTGTLSMIDTATSAVIAEVQVDNYVSGAGLALSPDGRKAYVSTTSGIQTIDTATRKVTGITSVSPRYRVGPISLSRDGRTLYGQIVGPGTLAVLDVNGDQLVARDTAETALPLENGVVSSPDGRVLYGPASHMGGGPRLLVIDAATGVARVGDIGDTAQDIALSPAGDRAYLPVYLSDVVLVVSVP